MAEPLPVCYLNGEYLPLKEARISPLDRGFLFADSAYEVLPVFAGRMFRFREHFDRLARSLNEIRVSAPHTHEQWLPLLEELIGRNGGGDMYVYVQVTRGTEFARNHAFPLSARPTVFAMAAPLPEPVPPQGLSAITLEEFRWRRCDIKSTALLANVLMKQQAVDAGAHEAIILHEGRVLEGASSSVFAVLGETIVTPPNGPRILPGTTREVALELAEGVAPVQIREIAVEELAAARELWITSATRGLAPITRLDGRAVGEGKPGPVWARLNARYDALRAALAGAPAL